MRGVEILYRSWKDIYSISKDSIKDASNEGKRLLKQLNRYFENIMTMQNHESNWVYCVSLGYCTDENWNIGYREIVNERSRYFHPIGKGWPTEPPNYLSFRYNGKLQSIHHIKNYTVFKDPNDHFKDIPSQKWRPYFLYELGPKIIPNHEVKNGKIYPSGRYWCMLDTLLTCETIFEARNLSREREMHN